MVQEDRLDFVAIGRAAVDLYGEQVGGRLEDMTSFAKYVGGSPTNTAIGATRLGLKTALITRVGDDHMGRFLREQLDREGVETSAVVTDPARLTALVLLGIRDDARFPLLFYRENCADMAIDEADIDPALLARAGALVLSGTHLSRPGVFAASAKAARLMRGGGGRVILDIDYRPVLWGVATPGMGECRFVADGAVTAKLQEILPLVDLVVGTQEEVHILGGSEDDLAALQVIRSRTDAPIVVKRSAAGCIIFAGPIPDRIEQGHAVPGFPVEMFNALGAGDAFMAGLLRGWLRGEPLETACRWGNACGALVVSRHGCAPAMPSWRELQHFMGRTDLPFRLRTDGALERLHWSVERTRRHDSLVVLAVDHRTHFGALAARTGAAPDRIAAFKALVLAATDRLAQGDPGFGILLDGGDGARALEATAELPYWVGRPIEVPGSRPVTFEGGAEVAVTLREWPAPQVVKCLVYYRMDDPAAVRIAQDEALLALFQACRATRHPLLIEVIVSAHGAVDTRSTAAVLEHLYEIGVVPDWWKLEPDGDPATWAAIADVIERHDPDCEGVLLLGLSETPEQLVERFAAAARFPVVKGFAVGRTIWHDAAERWFTGSISDNAAVEQIAANFQALVAAWRMARQA
jgi:5-dehydro-2-deoxygluconokinase